MKKLFFGITILAAGILLITACHKTPDTTNTNTVTPVITSTTTTTPTGTVTPTGTTYDLTKLNQLFAGLKSTPQTFYVAAGSSHSIMGSQGTVVNFYPHSFKDGSGHIITSGTVQIKLIEIYNPGAMISNRATTVTANGLLQSAGEVYISATMNGQEVYANKYGLAFNQAAASQQKMAIFYGNNNNKDSVITWSVGDTTKSYNIAWGTVNDSAGMASIFYQFDSCTNFNWVNCDHFSSYQPITDVQVTMPDTSFNPSNTQVFIVFTNLNCAVHCSMYNAATHTFSLYSGYYVPVGENGYIVATSNKTGNYYYFQQSAYIANNMTINATMTQHPLNYIQTQLLGL
jgi:hypothetical protein